MHLERTPLAATKTCCRCRAVKALDEFPRSRRNHDGRHEACKDCHRAQTRASAAKNPAGNARRTKEWLEKHPVERAAHAKVREAIRTGVLVRPEACEDCGQSGRIHAHHDDHTKPLEVRWVCARCHAAIQNAKRPIVDPLAATCPVCGREPGARCDDLNANRRKPTKHPHRPRVAVAAGLADVGVAA